MCWKQFTDGGLTRVTKGDYSVKRFKEYIDENLIRKYPNITRYAYLDSMQTKAFIRGGLGDIKIDSPHGCLKDGRIKTCNPVGMKCDNWIRIDKPTWKFACLNHYRFKTMEEFINLKMKRLWPTRYQNGGKGFLNKDLFFQFNRSTKEKRKLFDEIMKGK